MSQDESDGARRRQEKTGRSSPERVQSESRGGQEDTTRTRRTQEEPGGAMRSQGSQEEPGGARRSRSQGSQESQEEQKPREPEPRDPG